MKLYNVVKHEQAGSSKTIKTPIATGVTKTIADRLIATSPRVVADTVYVLTVQ